MKSTKRLVQTALVFSLMLPLVTGCIGLSDEDIARRAEEEGITKEEAERRRIEAAKRMSDYIPPIGGGE